MATSLAVARESETRFTDSVRFIGAPEYVYEVKRTFRAAPHRTITVTLGRDKMPPHVGAFAWPTVVEIVLELVGPTLDRIAAI